MHKRSKHTNNNSTHTFTNYSILDCNIHTRIEMSNLQRTKSRTSSRSSVVRKLLQNFLFLLLLSLPLSNRRPQIRTSRQSSKKLTGNSSRRSEHNTRTPRAAVCPSSECRLPLHLSLSPVVVSPDSLGAFRHCSPCVGTHGVTVGFPTAGSHDGRSGAQQERGRSSRGRGVSTARPWGCRDKSRSELRTNGRKD